MSVLMWPIIATWIVHYASPVPCEKDQLPDVYTKQCVKEQEYRVDKQFTDRKDWEAWYQTVPLSGTVRITDIEVYHFDSDKVELKRVCASSGRKDCPK